MSQGGGPERPHGSVRYDVEDGGRDGRIRDRTVDSNPCGHARSIDDQRYVELYPIQRPAVQVASVFAERLAVIRGDDQKQLSPPDAADLFMEPADFIIHIRDRAVV